jgi:hypothetical protein
MWAWWWVAACGGAGPAADGLDADPTAEVDTPIADDDTPGGEDPAGDTPTVEDTDPADTDIVDTDVADTDLVDTDLVDTDLSPAPDVSGTFVLTSAAALGADPPWLSPGDRAARQEPSRTVAFTADLDADGVEELIVSGHHGAPMPSGERRTVVFRLDAALAPTFEPTLSAALDALGAGVSGVLDLDGDGWVDVLLDRLDLGVAWGLGPGVFARPESLFAPADRATLRPSTSWMIDDVDADGWLDLVLLDRGCLDPRVVVPLRREGAHRFEIAPDVAQPGLDALVWTAFPLVPEPGARQIIVPAGSCDPSAVFAGFFDVDLAAPGAPRWSEVDALPWDAPFRFDPVVAGRPLTQTEPMGGVLADLDADGDGDLVVSLDSRWAEIFPWEAGAWGAVRWFAPSPTLGANGVPMFGWGMVALDVDRDRMPDLIYASGDDASSFFDDRIGPQRPLLWRNAGGFQFQDLTVGSGLERWGNWRALSAMDPDRDGDGDLLLGGNGFLPELLRQDPRQGHGVSLELVGTTSNHLAVGARVRLRDGAGPEPVVVVGAAGTPDLVARPWAFLGLGDATSATVEITWPSGLVQEVAGLASDRAHRVVEPETIVVTPASRRVPADGASTVEVVLQPRRRDGSPDPAAVATVEIAAGAGSWAGPATRRGDGWVRTLVAPDAPGEAVLEVTLGGVPLSVRPRVGFDAP